MAKLVRHSLGMGKITGSRPVNSTIEYSARSDSLVHRLALEARLRWFESSRADQTKVMSSKRGLRYFPVTEGNASSILVVTAKQSEIVTFDS
jgi:hypothetical protein